MVPDVENVNMTLFDSAAGVTPDTLIHKLMLTQPDVLTLADLSRLEVETTDLSERDVPLIAVGRPATVLVQASNEQITGRVAAIAPQSTIVGGDVVYAVTIALDDQPADLRWGMTVDVEIEGGE